MDYDGDGMADFTQFCNGAWHFYNFDGSYLKGIWTGGVAGDLPVPADYDGDGKGDVVVYRGGAWLFLNFTTGALVLPRAHGGRRRGMHPHADGLRWGRDSGFHAVV